jgi:hypothetical protein
MDKYETAVLFEHTQKLRAGGELLLLEPKEKEKQYAFYRKRDRKEKKSKRSKRQHEIQNLQNEVKRTADGGAESMEDELDSLRSRMHTRSIDEGETRGGGAVAGQKIPAVDELPKLKQGIAVRETRERTSQNMAFENENRMIERRGYHFNGFADETDVYSKKSREEKATAAEKQAKEQARRDRELSRLEREAEELEDKRERERVAAEKDRDDDEARNLFAQLKKPVLGPGGQVPASGFETPPSEEDNSSRMSVVPKPAYLTLAGFDDDCSPLEATLGRKDSNKPQVPQIQEYYTPADSLTLKSVASASTGSPNHSLLPTFNISDLSFGSQYGTLEFGMVPAALSQEEIGDGAGTSGLLSVDELLSQWTTLKI